MAQIIGTSGNDANLTGIDGEANDIYGDALVGQGGSFQGGDDTLTGGANSPLNNLYGDAGSIAGPGHGGNDMLIGGANSTNNLYGDAYSMGGGPSTGGDDTLIGGVGGINNMYGDAFEGGPGPQHGGNDRLVSAANTTDNMWGDFGSPSGSPAATFGSDTFVFGRHNGNDVINDFQHLVDKIEIDTSPIPAQAAGHIPPQALAHIPPQAGGNFPTTFTDLNITEVNGNSVIQFDAHDSVTVMNVTGLTAADFDFVA